MATRGEGQPGSRATRRARTNLRKIAAFPKFSKFKQNCSFPKQIGPHITFPWHYHLWILWALFKSSIYYFKQSCHFVEHLSIFSSTTTFDSQKYMRVRPHSGPLSYGFGICLTGGTPSTWFPHGPARWAIRFQKWFLDVFPLETYSSKNLAK